MKLNSSLAAVVVAALTLPAFAAAPANDSFSSPAAMTGFPASAAGSNGDATLETDESMPDNWYDSGKASVWFRWTAPTTGAVRIDTFGSDFDTMLAVWTGTAVNALGLLAENNQSGGDQSAVFISVLAGTTYQIGVYGWFDARGAIALHITNDTTCKIAGTVTGPNGTLPLEDIQATAYQWNEDYSDWAQKGSADSDASGHYTIRGLTAGTYRVQFRDYAGNYLPQVYSNAPSLNDGSNIVVAAHTTVSNVNAALANASKIAGTVTGPNGTLPLEGIQATAHQWNGESSFWESAGSGSTDASGHYTIRGLTAGTYRVQFRDFSGNYLPQVYSNAPSLDDGSNIVVAAHTTVSNVNAALANASKIAGTVTGPNGTLPLEGIQATAYQWNGESSFWEGAGSGSGSTDASGHYTIRGLTAGTYRVQFWDSFGNYLPQVYSNAPSLDDGSNIVVAAHTTVSNVNAALANASKIAGTVTGTNGTLPLADIQATAYQWNEDLSDWAQKGSDYSDASGHYTIRGLTAGTYRVQFEDYAGNYLPQVYSNAPTLGAGGDIVVAAHATVSNVNAALATASKIAGTVTGPDGTTPLDSVWVYAYRLNDADWENVGGTSTGTGGHYFLGGLSAGTYRIRFVDGSGTYSSEAYSNAVDIASGTDIVVPAGTTVSNVNASLATYSGISGTVTGPDGTTGLNGVWVYVYRWNGAAWAYMNETSTGAGGQYSLGGLSAGTYRIRFVDGSGTYSSVAYSNAVDIASGTDIVVPAGTTVSNVNASLPTWSEISGTVTGTDGTTPLLDVQVYAYRWNGTAWAYMSETATGAGGLYSLGGLSAGTYRIRFVDGSETYSSEAYSNAVDIASGTDIVVPAGTTVSNVNASLRSVYATISGTVTGPDGTTPLQGVQVLIYSRDGAEWDYMGGTSTGAGGHYSIGWLATGTYRIWFEGLYGNYVAEAFTNALSLDAGIDVAAVAGEIVAGVDASLAILGTVEPSQVVNIQKTGVDAFDLSMTGTGDRYYMLQWTLSPTGSWANVGSAFNCETGNNVISLAPSGSAGFWRVILAP